MAAGNTRRDQGNIRYRTVDVISLKTSGKVAFCERYLQPGISCVIEDLITEWPAFHKWDKDYLKQACGETRVFFHHKSEGRTDFARPATQTTLSDFMVRIENGEPIRFSALRTPCMTSSPTIRSLPTTCASRSLPASFPTAASSAWTDWILDSDHGYRFFRRSSMSPGHYDQDLSHTFHCCF